MQADADSAAPGARAVSGETVKPQKKKKKAVLLFYGGEIELHSNYIIVPKLS